jgi:spore coat polysaccharide biosynthesis protein SpsF
MRLVAIIQARMGSTRLPGKVLKDVGGESVLARVVRRIGRATLLDDVTVATSILSEDDVIAEDCIRLGVHCFRGDPADVLNRYYRAAEFCGADVVVRITADCPLIDPELADNTIHEFIEQRPDYASNSLVSTYPSGLSVEVFTLAALQRAWQEAKQSHHRVHVTPYLYENPQLFRILSLAAEADYSRYRWTLDTEEDLEAIRAIYQHFANRDTFNWRHALALMERAPEVPAMNSHVRQKALREG